MGLQFVMCYVISYCHVENKKDGTPRCKQYQLLPAMQQLVLPPIKIQQFISSTFFPCIWLIYSIHMLPFPSLPQSPHAPLFIQALVICQALLDFGQETHFRLEHDCQKGQPCQTGLMDTVLRTMKLSQSRGFTRTVDSCDYCGQVFANLVIIEKVPDSLSYPCFGMASHLLWHGGMPCVVWNGSIKTAQKIC